MKIWLNGILQINSWINVILKKNFTWWAEIDRKPITSDLNNINKINLNLGA